ncbi:Protein NEP-17 a, partial [Aphelenchoides avenae]
MAKTSAITVLALILAIAILVFVLAVFGLSIATLVKVSKSDGDRQATRPRTRSLLFRLPILVRIPDYLNAFKGNTTTTKPAPNPNIPSLPVSSSDKYKLAAQYLSKAMNLSNDPCDDFYSYACGAYTQQYDPLALMIREIYGDLVTYLKSVDTTAVKPVQQYKQYTDACVQFSKNRAALTSDGKYAKQQVQALATASTLAFPLIDGTTPTTFPDATTLGKALGNLKGVLDAKSFLDILVLADPVDPTGTHPYWLVINPNGPDADVTKDTYAAQINQLLKTYAGVAGKVVAEPVLQAAVDDIVVFEKALLAELGKLPLDPPPTQTDLRNPVKISDAQTQYGAFVSITEYIAAATTNADDTTKGIVNKPGYQISIPAFTDTFLKALQQKVLVAGNSYGVKPSAVYNYLYYQVIKRYEQFLPTQTNVKALSAMEILHRQHKKKKHDPFKTFPFPSAADKWETIILADADDDKAALVCVSQSADKLVLASSRAYADAILPTDDLKKKMRDSVVKMLTDVIVAFQSMIDQLNWMTQETKQKAYLKIDNIVMNIGWPDDANYVEMLFEVEKFAKREMFAPLSRTTGTDRTGWPTSSATANAFYQPRYNSITMPLGILRAPMFDFDWPVSVNYGAIGVVLGHELVHGFDTTGVQWDQNGKNINWMDAASQAEFDKMAKCVVDEYDKFCPLSSKYTPNCVQGKATQTENIADNG